MNDKPISIVLDDLSNDIASLINETELPACLIVPILKDLYLEAAEVAKIQLKNDRKQYQETIEQKNKETTEE